MAASSAKLAAKGVLNGRIQKKTFSQTAQSVQDADESEEGDADDGDWLVDEPMFDLPFDRNLDHDGDGGAGGFGAPETLSQVVF